jgi:hypothetical protein
MACAFVTLAAASATAKALPEPRAALHKLAAERRAGPARARALGGHHAPGEDLMQERGALEWILLIPEIAGLEAALGIGNLATANRFRRHA